VIVRLDRRPVAGELWSLRSHRPPNKNSPDVRNDLLIALASSAGTLDRRVDVVVASSFFRLTDGAGRPIRQTDNGLGESVPLLVTSRDSAPIIHLRVAGIN
jgi:hypothetical protein